MHGAPERCQSLGNHERQFLAELFVEDEQVWEMIVGPRGELGLYDARRPNYSPTANLPGVYPPTERGARGRRGRDGRSGTGRAALPRIHSGRNF